MVTVPSFLKRSDPKVIKIFSDYLIEITHKAENLFIVLFLFQWVMGIVFALLISPTTWSGQDSQIHIHVYAAIFLGGALAAFPIFMIYAHPGRAITRHIIALSQILVSALLIHLTGGRIETHFHVFGSLAFLSFFRDWRVLVTATLVTALDHFLRGIFWPQSVYGVLSATPWRSLEHAAWVIFEDIVLIYSIRTALREVGRIAEKEQKIQTLNETLEDRVASRTRELIEIQAKAEATTIQFSAIFDNAGVGIMALDRDSNVSLANPAILRMLGYTLDELLHKNVFYLTHPDDVEASKNNHKKTGKGGHFYQSKRYLKKDGTYLWTRISAAMMAGKNKDVGSFAIIQDITAEKASESLIREQEARIQAAAVEAAHTTGMSEIATGVLHNVGNVLNSANVGLETIIRQFDKSVVGNLFKANDLLMQNRPRLGEFLSVDPKGKKLVDFYLELGGAVKNEIAGQKHEATELMKRLQLIKDIINTQQTYAKGSAEFKEKISLAEIVENALIMQTSSLSRHGVKVVKKFSNVPLIVAQRSKLVHVVLNLIKNAKEAMDSVDDIEKVISLEIGETGSGSVFFKVTDTGMGISKENISKVFTHGFTTKPMGHGFGLHFCANSASEMGAKISVSSDGEKLGASFMVEFSENDKVVAA